MSRLKFDFSGIQLIKMPDEKKKTLKKFKKPKFVKPLNPKTPEIITLSDSEELKDQVEIIEEPPDVIDLSESSSEEEPKHPSVEIVTLDDSDSFCNKACKHGKVCTVSASLDYIPIPQCISNKRKNKEKKRKNKAIFQSDETQVKKRKKIQTPLLKLSHSNIYDGSNQKASALRPIVIDGCNVAFQYGNGKFEIKGVILVIQYFLNRGHTDITCFLPAHFRHTNKTDREKEIVNAYERDKIITYTPSRKLISGKSITPYDDRFVVQYASVSGGVIISNDGYRDLLHEEDSWQETIEKRLINYTFAKDIFMLPKDPLGPYGPSLDEILKFS